MAKYFLVAFVMSVAISVAASELDLARTCIIRAQRENPQQKIAADDLAKHLELITGIKPHEGKLADATAVFSFVRPSDCKRDKFTAFARREGSLIRFWGDDTVTKGKAQYGSAFAVSEFLEKFLGVLWVSPNDEGIVFSPSKHCDVPDDWNWERKYPFYVSMMRSIDPLWCIRMKSTI